MLRRLCMEAAFCVTWRLYSHEIMHDAKRTDQLSEGYGKESCDHVF
jgi:hypothetical protein